MYKRNTIRYSLSRVWRGVSVAFCHRRTIQTRPSLALVSNCTLDLHAKAPHYRFFSFKNNHIYFAIKKLGNVAS